VGTLGPVGIPVFSTDSTENSVGFMVAGSMSRSMRFGNWIAEARAPVAVKAVRRMRDFIIAVVCM
jgi:hypothetical protein